MERDKINELIDRFIDAIIKVLHEGINYLDYTIFIISLVCLITFIYIEGFGNYTIFYEASLKDILNVYMVAGAVPYLFRELYRLILVYSLVSRYDMKFYVLLRNMIKYILYCFITLLLVDIMAIDRVIDYIYELMPTGALIIMIFYTASILGRWVIDRKLGNVLQRKDMDDDHDL